MVEREAAVIFVSAAHLFLRSAGLVFIVPPFREFLGMSGRISLVIALALLGVVILDRRGMLAQDIPLLLEFPIGILLGLPLLLAQSVLEGIGELLDTTRGQSMQAVYNPGMQEGTFPLSQLFRLLLWGVILQSDIFSELVQGLLECGRPGAVHTWRDAMELANVLLSSLAGTFYSFLPIGMALVSIDLLVGMVSRFFPGYLVQGESFIAKSTFLAVLLLVPDMSSLLFQVGSRYLVLLQVHP